MPRRSRSTGVGRGNGPGSAATQQKPGMPSLNPHGRPKKYTPPPPSTMAELVAREVAKRVSGVANGRPFDRPMVEVMVAHLMADYPKMSPAMKLRTVEWVARLVPDLKPPVVHQSHDAAVSALVNRLAEEYWREHPEDIKFAMECDEHARRVQAAG